MISAILISSLWMLVSSASVVPIDGSSSTVNVKQGTHEYSYHIQESHGIAVQPGHPVPLLKSPIILNSLQPKSSENSAKTDGLQQPQGQLKGIIKDDSLSGQQQGQIKEDFQRQPYEQLKIVLPGYQLLSGAGNSLVKEEGLEKQQLQEQLKISSPSYRLLPGNANIQYVDLPYYYPYVHGYGLQYPYNLPLVRYI